MLYHSVIFHLAPCSNMIDRFLLKGRTTNTLPDASVLTSPQKHTIWELGQFSSDFLFQWLFYHCAIPIIIVRQPWPGSKLIHSSSLSFELNFCGPAFGWLRTKTGNEVNRLKRCDTVVHPARYLRSLMLDKHFSLKRRCLSTPDPHLRKQNLSTPVSVVKSDVNLTAVS